jgi:membrane-associated protease RseP (regulator of RpoE activity)
LKNIEFQDVVVDKIEGWLNRVASLRTMDILSNQERSGFKGSLLEIGIYNGKYFSVLARSAQRMGDRLVGVDTFQWKSENDVMSALALSSETSSVKVEFVRSFSHECDPQSLLSKLETRPRFISIDGSHHAPDVLLDLELSEDIVSTRGVIAVDDFINPVALGVNEGVHLFFSRPRRVVPFSYIGGKLFLAQRGFAADAYRLFIEQAVIADEVEPSSQRFRELAATSRNMVEQRLWGHPLITCP